MTSSPKIHGLKILKRQSMRISEEWKITSTGSDNYYTFDAQVEHKRLDCGQLLVLASEHQIAHF